MQKRSRDERGRFFIFDCMKVLKIFIPFLFLVVLASCGDDESFTPVSRDGDDGQVAEDSLSQEDPYRDGNSDTRSSSSNGPSSVDGVSSSSGAQSSSSGPNSSSDANSSAVSSSGINSSSSAVSSSSGKVSSSSADTGRKLVIKTYMEVTINFTNASVQSLDATLHPQSDTKYSGALDSLAIVVKNLPLDLNYAKITLEKTGFSQSIYANLAGVDTLYVYPVSVTISRRIEALINTTNTSFDQAKIQAENEVQRPILGDVRFHNLEKINLEADKSDSALWAKSFVNLMYYAPSCVYGFGQYTNTGEITVDPLGVAGIIDKEIQNSVNYCPRGERRIYCDSAVYKRLYPVCDSLSGREKCTAANEGVIDTIDFGCAGTGAVKCDNLEWRHLNTYEVDTYEWERPCTTPGYKLGNQGFDMYFCNKKGEWINTQGWSWDIDKDYVLSPKHEYGTVTDPRDGKVYKTIAAEGMVWMAQNLDFRGYVDNSLEDSSLVENMKDKYACYKDSAEYCDVCGTLYDIHAIMNINGGIDMSNPYIIREYIQRNHQGICPEGWHVPTQAEIKHFLSTSRPEYIASRFGWESDLFTGRFADQYGLSVMPCGYKEKGAFDGVGYKTYIAALDSPDVNINLILFNETVEMYLDVDAYLHEGALVSVRCVKNR